MVYDTDRLVLEEQSVSEMTQGQSAASATGGIAFARLSELENERAVERIETAEREDPTCVCGAHMVAVARNGSLWLECSNVQRRGDGARGLLRQVMDMLGHSRRRIMDLPASN